MRTLTILFAFSALAVAFVFLDRITAPGEGARPTPASAEALSIAEVLADHAGLAVMGIVLGRRDGDQRDFRGLHLAEGRMRPVYGRVRTLCPVRATGPSCWEVSYLEMDGRQVESRVAALETLPSDETAEERIETADTGGVAPVSDVLEKSVPPPSADERAAEPDAPADAVSRSTPDTANAEADGESERAVADAAPVPSSRPAATPDDSVATGAAKDADLVRKPTHAVARPIINVRSGPGTDRDVVARLPEGMRLALIDRRDDWGRFVVLDGAASGREVWAALRILERLP